MIVRICQHGRPEGPSPTGRAVDVEPRARFTSFTQIADEIGASRVYVGYHFHHAVIDGLAQGQSIGEYTVAQVLTTP